MGLRSEVRGVRYVSFAENSGYGLAAQAYLRALLEAGVAVEWLPLIATPAGYQPWDRVDGGEAWLERLAHGGAGSGDFGPEINRTIGRAVDYDTVLLHCVPEYWPRHRERGARHLGCTVWETDALPPHWGELLNATDRLLVPCRFNEPVLRASGVDRPIDVVPHIAPAPVPVAAERAGDFRATYAIPDDHFVFYAIDVWSPRKAPWKTLTAFLRAFTAADRVSFVFKTSDVGPRSGAEVENRPTELLAREIVAHHGDSGQVVVIAGELPAADIAALHATGDCYLSLTHSEGWGLGAFAAVAAGNPVIITGWGGHLDYLGDDWPYLVEFELTPVINAQGRGSYLPSHRWAAASLDHAVDLLRAVRRDPEPARALGASLAERVHAEFNGRAVGRKLVAAIEGTT